VARAVEYFTLALRAFLDGLHTLQRENFRWAYIQPCVPRNPKNPNAHLSCRFKSQPLSLFRNFCCLARRNFDNCLYGTTSMKRSNAQAEVPVMVFW